MTRLTRRAVMAGAATAVAAGTMTRIEPAAAAVPPADKQAPGFYRYKIGSLEVTVVTDGASQAPVGKMVKNAPIDQLNAALAEAFLPKDILPLVFNPCVVNTGGKLVMIDTGYGPAMFEKSKGAAGQAHTNLAAAGIDRGKIETVVISHFHPDHINGLLNTDNTPAFANAEVLVPEGEWAFWMDDGQMSRAPEGLKGAFANVRRVFGPLKGKVKPYGDNKELAPGITSMATPGHTPGHSSHVLSSGNDSVVVQADVTNYPALFVRHPGWHLSFDMDADKAEATRRKLYDQLAADRTRLQGYHFPFPSNGHLVKDGDGYRYVAVPWKPTL